ncbi:hypothetical protein [Pedobacter frigoris]|uniref:hypothetical protein n=1 Tax=Pedobacter frigoris TaxID=2571272 RepID=UPI002930E84C|nr:hypothetical protein [Pedobacter frigoris]
MKIAVTDANIFIDLIKLDLISYLFKLNLEIHTTREVYDQLHAGQQEKLSAFLLSGDLLVYNFNVDEIAEIYRLEMPKGLEPADRSVYYYAAKLKLTVLSGDNKLRKFCTSKRLEVKGILWLIRSIVESDLITRENGKSKIEHLISYNDRLPMEECTNMIKEWG